MYTYLTPHPTPSSPAIEEKRKEITKKKTFWGVVLIMG